MVHVTLAGSPQNGTATEKVWNDTILTQNVYGESVIFMHVFSKNVTVKNLSFPADHPDHLIFFRKHVSRTAAGKGRAVLEGVGLHTAAIGSCFKNHPQDTEAAVQAGLTKWIEGRGRQPPTWKVLVEAMEYAQIAQQHIQDLRASLDLH